MNISFEELLGQFAMPPTAAESQEVAYGLEGFSMPVRAVEQDLAPYQEEKRWIEAGDAIVQVPTQLDRVEAVNEKSTPNRIMTVAQAHLGATASQEVAVFLKELLRQESKTVIWHTAVESTILLQTAKIRVAKGLALEAGKDLEVTVRANEKELGSQDGYSNLFRLTMAALVANMVGAKWLYLPAWSYENTEGHQLIKNNIQRIIQHESHISDKNALLGAYWPTLLACRLFQRAKELSQLSDKDLHDAIERDGWEKKKAVMHEDKIWVGENRFQNNALTILGPRRTR